MKVGENGQTNGRIEIIFSSSKQSAFVGSSGSSMTGQVSGWYSGNTATLNTNVATISSGTTLDWQNSTMLVVIRDATGNRLYTADYKYKGGWEMSGFSVNTAPEAARLCLQRINTKMRADLKF